MANKCERKMKRQFISDYKWRRRNLSSAKLISHDARVFRSWLLDLCDVRIKNSIVGYGYRKLMIPIVLLSRDLFYYELVINMKEDVDVNFLASCEGILKKK